MRKEEVEVEVLGCGDLLGLAVVAWMVVWLMWLRLLLLLLLLWRLMRLKGSELCQMERVFQLSNSLALF